MKQKIFDITGMQNYIEISRSQGSPFFRSSPRGDISLEATVYAAQLYYYITGETNYDLFEIEAILGTQDPQTGFFIGPEFTNWRPSAGTKHNFEYLCSHLTCAVLPALELYGVVPRFPLRFAHRFLDTKYLKQWLAKRDWTDAWLEGNYLLFVLQTLTYLRDRENIPEANDSLQTIFRWLDVQIDSRTGLWGTNGYCLPHTALYGGYHQLLAYYYENQPLLYRERLIDTVLRIQHPDGGFSLAGGGGVCEDVDAVDVLVNMYKQVNYKRSHIRLALRRCLKHTLRMQNPDGGFPYKAGMEFRHNGIPATYSGPGESNMWCTWFRVHSIALMAQILTDEQAFEGVRFFFNESLSMGWHKPWNIEENRLTLKDNFAEIMTLQIHVRQAARLLLWALGKFRPRRG
jgi:hypothetical protein